MASSGVDRPSALLKAVDEYVAACYGGENLISTADAIMALRRIFPADEFTDAFLAEISKSRAEALGFRVTADLEAQVTAAVSAQHAPH